MFRSAVKYYSGGAFSLMLFGAFFMLYPERGLVFDVTPRIAYESLRQTGLPPLVFGDSTTGKVIVNSATSITWSVQQNGREMMRYTALLSPEPDNRTRVTVDFRTGATGIAAQSAERLDKNLTVRKLYLAAIKERISSSLEGRTFNVALLYPMTIVAGIANHQAIYGQLDEVARAQNERARDNIRKAYRQGDGF